MHHLLMKFFQVVFFLIRLADQRRVGREIDGRERECADADNHEHRDEERDAAPRAKCESLPANTALIVVNPVMFPPDRAKLLTSPEATGSGTLKKQWESF